MDIRFHEVTFLGTQNQMKHTSKLNYIIAFSDKIIIHDLIIIFSYTS